jgi:hypothetical protein
MPYSLNKQYMKVVLIATVTWAQELTNSELRLESYEGFMIKGIFVIFKRLDKGLKVNV